MSPARIAELRALADAATPGPWRHVRAVVTVDKGDICGCDDVNHVGDAEQNAAFVAAVRTAVPELLDALHDSEARVQDYLREVERREEFLAAADARASEAEASLAVARAALETITQVTPEHLVGAAFVAHEALAKLPPARRTP